MVDAPKVEFAVGSQVSPISFYKSAFARSFAINNSRETKSLDFAFMNSETIAEEPNDTNTNTNITNDNENNNFVSQDTINGSKTLVNSSDVKLWRINETSTDNDQSTAMIELEKLRKECQNLAEENRRLHGTLGTVRTPQSRVIDNVLLQNQIDTLQWQLKQTEANRQMYRALMGQVVRFLDRAHKSLDILNEKYNPKSTKLPRVPRSRSVHAVDNSSPNRCSTQSSNSFSRAKSVTQISPTTSNGPSIRDSSSVWSILRRNETPPPGTTAPRPADIQIKQNQSHDGVVYRRRPKQSENNPDEVPPERLSQEAFRLMRTVQSLLATREPDLVRVSEPDENASPSPCDHEMTLPPNFANSTVLNDSLFSGCSSSDRGSSRSDHDDTPFNNYRKSGESNGDGVCLLPGARTSLDATSLHSGSSKTNTSETTEEDDQGGPRSLLAGVLANEFSGTPSSAPNRRKKPTAAEPDVRFKPKPSASVSSAEDESGFSSMSSFQDVGLPNAPSPVKGCHTEVGLPEVPLNKVRHRRWSSTPAEMQALLNSRHNASFTTAKTTSEALKVLWV